MTDETCDCLELNTGCSICVRAAKRELFPAEVMIRTLLAAMGMHKDHDDPTASVAYIPSMEKLTKQLESAVPHSVGNTFIAGNQRKLWPEDRPMIHTTKALLILVSGLLCNIEDTFNDVDTIEGIKMSEEQWASLRSCKKRLDFVAEKLMDCERAISAGQLT